jgi:hypothetical protein
MHVACAAAIAEPPPKSSVLRSQTVFNQASDQFLATTKLATTKLATNKAICLKTKKINKSKMYF